jgi:hypothetical protein
MKHLDEFRQLRLHAGRQVAVSDQEVQGHRRARDLEILTKNVLSTLDQKKKKQDNVKFFKQPKGTVVNRRKI